MSKEWGSPRRIVATLAEAVEIGNANSSPEVSKQSYTVLYRGECANLRHSAFDEGESGEFVLPPTTPPVFPLPSALFQHVEYVAELRNARVFSEGECSMLIVSGDAIVTDCFHWASGRNNRYGSFAHRRLRLPPVKIVPGKSLYLPRGTNNYYHFLIDTLSQIALAKNTHQLSSFDYFVMPPVESQFGKHILFDVMGLQKEQIVSTTDRHLEFGHLVVPTVFNRAGNWYVSQLQQWFNAKKDGAARPKRLYVTRRGASVRRVVNEAAVADVLTGEFGFTALQSETLSVSAQIARFAQAEAIVGVHGAGLTNMLFYQPNTFVCELRHHKHWGTVSGCYQALAEDAGLDYAALLCGDNGGQNDVLAKSKDIVVDLDALRRALQHLPPGI